MTPFREYRKLADGSRQAFARWRGRVVENGRRRKVVLFTDYRASERELRRLQAEADHESQDGIGARRRKHAGRPILEHVAEYMEFVKRTTKSTEHHRIAEWMLKKLVEVSGWQRLSDISQEAMEGVLKKLATAERPATVAYQNCFLKRAKAFVHWCIPDRLLHDPLAKMRRGSTVRAKKNRARRAGTVEEIRALMAVCPPEYQFKFAWPVLTGFRRTEFELLKWDDLRMNATIPFIQLRPEWTKNDKADYLPLHPDLVRMLRSRMPGMPEARVVDSVPDVATLKAYIERAKLQFTKDGKRLDYHALRHTFKTWLDEAALSETTKKALTRHAVRDVSEGYSHPRLAELYAAICRLPSPFAAPSAEAKTGTDDMPVGGTQLGHGPCISLHADALPCTVGRNEQRTESVKNRPENQGDCTPLHGSARSELKSGKKADIMRKTRPSTQVD